MCVNPPWPSLAAFADRNAQIARLAAAQHPNRGCLADTLASEQELQTLGVLHRLAREADKRIADQEPGLLGRAVRLEADDEQAAGLSTRLRRQRFVQLDSLAADAEEASLHLAMRHQRLHHPFYSRKR